MAFAVTGHLECVVFLPVSLFMVCHALRLECVKSTYSTTSVHLALRTSSSVRSSAVAVMSMSSLVVACWCLRGGGCICRPIRGCSVCRSPVGCSILHCGYNNVAMLCYVAYALSACGFGRHGVLLSVSAVNNSQLAFRKFHLF